MDPQQENQTPPVPEPVSSHKILWILLPVFILVVISGLLVFYPQIIEQVLERYNPRTLIDDTSMVDTTNWKTYRNEKYGLEFKYPDNWKIDGESIKFDYVSGVGGIDLYKGYFLNNNIKNGSCKISIWLDENPDTFDYDPVFVSKDYSISSSSTINIGGLNGWRFKDRETSADGIYLRFSGKEEFRSSLVCDPIIISVGTDEFNQILSTFKFTPATSTVDTTNWKTYINDKYGFEFKYPKEYKIVEENGNKFLDFYNVKISTPETQKIRTNTTGEKTDEMEIYPEFSKSDLVKDLGLPEAIVTEIYLKSDIVKARGNTYLGSIKLGNRSGLQILHIESSDTIYTISENNNGSYFVTMYHESFSPLVEFNQIISTFKFTN